VDRLGPEPGAVLGRDLLEREPENIAEGFGGRRTNVVDR
jgi:hypothetical protein